MGASAFAHSDFMSAFRDFDDAATLSNPCRPEGGEGPFGAWARHGGFGKANLGRYYNCNHVMKDERTCRVAKAATSGRQPLSAAFSNGNALAAIQPTGSNREPNLCKSNCKHRIGRSTSQDGGSAIRWVSDVQGQ